MPNRIGNPHLKKPAGDWVCVIDADERLSEKLQKNMRKLVHEAAKENINGYQVKWVHYDHGKKITSGARSKNTKLILFKKKVKHYTGIVHDISRIHGKVKETNLELYHKEKQDNLSFKTLIRKHVPRADVDANHRIKAGFARKPAILYLFKSPLLFVLYFAYEFTTNRTFLDGINGLRLTLHHATYASILY